MNIKNDLKNGDIGENIVSNILNNAGFRTGKHKGNNLADFDLWASLEDYPCSTPNLAYFTIEVKYDLYSEKSDNIAIEFFNTNQNKPSGIMSTKSHLWAFVTPTQGTWLASTKTLRNYIAQHQPFRIITNAGDGNANLYLYKMTEILPSIFIRCDELSIKTLREVINNLLL